MQSVKYIASFLIIIQLVSCNDISKNSTGVLSGRYWKEQALNDIIPYWTRYSQNERSGTFHTNLDSAWNQFGSTEIYPSMIARNLFGYSAAYLLSGNDEYIDIADKTARWLIEKAWDKESGLWYDALDEEGNPTMTSKTTFVQVYVITGLTLYYFVTHDSTVLHYIEKSNELMEQKVWDKEGEGYFNMVNRDWSAGDSGKSFSSEITPVSGYLIYLYLATRDQEYQNQIDRILDLVTEKMVDKETGWVLEDFDRKWIYNQLRNDASEISIGHNIETSWMLLKNYLLTSNENQKQAGLNIAFKIKEAGVFNENNVWLGTADRTDLSRRANDTYWWIQAYGNMVSLYLYKVTGDKKYLDDFKKGSDLWDRCFLDRKHGDTFFRIDSAGNMLDATKAGRYKASYHNMEHCLVNYQCLNLWVNNEPVEFHFRINSSDEGDLLNPVLLEGKDINIEKAVLEDGSGKVLKTEGQSVILPAGTNYRIDVILGNR
jgi:mannose/cellobiose epimerase-like protein (N-acyl-D-glucosamine 2-epimerase family)